MRQEVNRPLLILACRHHVWEIILKHYWESVPIDVTTGPYNVLFNGLKNKCHEIDMENLDLCRFAWDKPGSWLEIQALESKQQLRMLVRCEVFRNSKSHKNGRITLSLRNYVSCF